MLPKRVKIKGLKLENGLFKYSSRCRKDNKTIHDAGTISGGT